MLKKMTFEYDENAVNAFINELKEEFPAFDINLDNANDFAKMLEEKKNCIKCKGLSNCKNICEGHQTTYVDGVFVAKECKYKKQLKESLSKESLIKTLYLPKNVLDADLAHFDTNSISRNNIYQNTLSLIESFKKNNPVKKGLYLHGSFSKGKTYALACIANELAKNNVECLLIYFPDLVVDLKNAIGTSRFESLLNMLKSVDVLMFDDFGSENMTPWLRDEVLGPVINYRMADSKPLFISSNIRPNDLKIHLAIDKDSESKLKADRIISRMTSLLSSIDMDDSNTYPR